MCITAFFGKPLLRKLALWKPDWGSVVGEACFIHAWLWNPAWGHLFVGAWMGKSLVHHDRFLIDDAPFRPVVLPPPRLNDTQ